MWEDSEITLSPEILLNQKRNKSQKKYNLLQILINLSRAFDPDKMLYNVVIYSSVLNKGLFVPEQKWYNSSNYVNSTKGIPMGK